jgi:excisionase family DNA binding protein
MPECQTLNVKSSATELGVCQETVRRLVRRKVLRKLPGLRRILIPKAEVQRYLETGNGAVPLKTLSKSGPEKIPVCVSMVGPAGFEPATKRL